MRSLAPEDIDRLIDAHGTLPGEFMGSVFSMMTPMRTMLKYNIDLLEVVDDEKKFLNFLRMEKWIADRPHHPGEAAKQWLKDLYQDNKLVRSEFELGGRKVELEEHHLPGAQRVRQGRPHHPAGDLAGARRPGRHEGLHRAGAAGRACRRLRRRQVAGAARPRHRQMADGAVNLGELSEAGNPRAACRIASKIVPVEDAVAIIRSGDTVATSGFVGVGTPDAAIAALEQRFLETGEPRDLTLVFAAAPGDGRDKGLNRLAQDGFVRRVVGGHFGLVPKLARMAIEGTVEAYNLPLGCISQLFREIAGRKAGLLSKVGLQDLRRPARGRRQAQRRRPRRTWSSS